MARSVVVKVAYKMVEINSRLGNINNGLTMLCIRSRKDSDSVQLRQMTMRPDYGSPSTKLHKTFKNYDEMLPYLENFNDGLKFAGLKLG